MCIHPVVLAFIAATYSIEWLRVSAYLSTRIGRART